MTWAFITRTEKCEGRIFSQSLIEESNEAQSQKEENCQPPCSSFRQLLLVIAQDDQAKSYA